MWHDVLSYIRQAFSIPALSFLNLAHKLLTNFVTTFLVIELEEAMIASTFLSESAILKLIKLYHNF